MSPAKTAGLKSIYLAPSAEPAASALDAFAEVWDAEYPMISKSRRSRWNEVIPFFKFSPDIRKAVYTTNAIESVNYTIQKLIKHRQPFPNDEAAVKLIQRFYFYDFLRNSFEKNAVCGLDGRGNV